MAVSELCPRGPWNELLQAANEGCFESVFRIVCEGSSNINVSSSKGYTPLMLASNGGHGVIVRFLLNNGAIATAMAERGVTALHVAAEHNHTSVATMLLAAGADVGASCASSRGLTALHLAAHRGKWEVMQVLIRAKADVNARLTDGATAMYLAAEAGKLKAVKVLLLHQADASIATQHGATALDVAAERCHTEIVREMVDRVGIEGCGGVDQSSLALRLAAKGGHTGIMRILHAAGSRDKNGVVLCVAVTHGRLEAVRFLLERPCYSGYANIAVGKPLSCCLAVSFVTASTPRIMRMLIDAGADTNFEITCLEDGGTFRSNSSLLQVVTKVIREKKSESVVLNQDQIHAFQAMRRLLLQVDAARAVTWGWTNSAATPSTPNGPTNVPPPAFSVWRERAATKSRLFQMAIFRYTRKTDTAFMAHQRDA